jgi:hypothetical protein
MDLLLETDLLLEDSIVEDSILEMDLLVSIYEKDSLVEDMKFEVAMVDYKVE